MSIWDRIFGRKAAQAKGQDKVTTDQGQHQAMTCSLCGCSGPEEPADWQVGHHELLPEVTAKAPHVLRELYNGWLLWKRWLMTTEQETRYFMPRFYCPTCRCKIRDWVQEYGRQIGTALEYGSNTRDDLRSIGRKLYELGGESLMVMSCEYAGYYGRPGDVRVIEMAWTGIGGWMG